jgi:hypothetical protein
MTGQIGMRLTIAAVRLRTAWGRGPTRSQA